MSDIFLSYARSDERHAEALARALQAEGWTVWWDRKIPAGLEFALVIEEQIDAARCIIVIWSRDAIQSRWVRTEASAGLEREVLVPVRIEALDRLPLAFRSLHTADLSSWNGDRQNVGFQQLMIGVRELIIAGVPRKKRDEDTSQAAPETSEDTANSRDHARTLPLHRSQTAFSADDEMIVPSSGRKLLGLVAIAMTFVLIAFWDMGRPEKSTPVLDWFNVLFFGAAGIFALRRLIWPAPALIINRNGILDNASAAGVGFVRWEDIDDLRAHTFLGQNYLGVYLKNDAALLGRLPFWKRLLIRTNKHIVPTPVNIPQVILPITIPELLREVGVRFGQ